MRPSGASASMAWRRSALTTAFLFVLLADIVWRSLPAFTQYSAVLEVTVDPEKVDAAKPAAGDFEGW